MAYSAYRSKPRPHDYRFARAYTRMICLQWKNCFFVPAGWHPKQKAKILLMGTFHKVPEDPCYMQPRARLSCKLVTNGEESTPKISTRRGISRQTCLGHALFAGPVVSGIRMGKIETVASCSGPSKISSSCISQWLLSCAHAFSND